MTSIAVRLSKAQHQFAAALSGELTITDGCSSGSVVFYERLTGYVNRWIVDTSGDLLAVDRFREPAQRAQAEARDR